MAPNDRRTHRFPLSRARRRDGRVFLDVDWFVESKGCATLGRGLEVSVRSAALRIARTTDFTGPVTLYLSLPARPRMFRARGLAAPANAPVGWVIRFAEVSDEDLLLLGQMLLDEAGVEAFPDPDQTWSHLADLDGQ